MRRFVACFSLLLLSICLLVAETAAQLPFVFGNAYHILPQTHNRESGSFSLCEGLDGKVYVGTAKYGINSFLVELDQITSGQRVVIDTHKISSYAGTGIKAQSMLTRSSVAPSGVVHVGSRQGSPATNENAWSYPGGYIMSYDPRTETAKSFGMPPCNGYGIIDVAADESRGLIYYICRQDTTGDHLWGLYDTRKKQHRLLGPHTSPFGSTLLDPLGIAYVLTSDYKLAAYNSNYDQLNIIDVLGKDDKQFAPAPAAVPGERAASWVIAPDGLSAYLLLSDSGNLYNIALASIGKWTSITEMGNMLPAEKVKSSSSLVMHPDGNIYALFTTADPAGRTKGDVNVLVRYESQTKTIKSLGVLAIKNTDYFDFSPLKDGSQKPFSNGVEKLDNNTLVPNTHSAMITGHNGSLYVLISEPFALLKIDDFHVPPPPVTPATKWLDFSLAQCDRIEKNMPEITLIAEKIAKRYIAGGRLDVIMNSNNGWPGQGPQGELTGRAGGMIDLGARFIPDEEDLSRPAEERANDVIIIGWQRAATDGDLDRIKLYRSRGAKILAFGPKGLPALAEFVPLCDYWIDTGAGGDDRAVTLDDGRKVGRSNVLNNLLDGWVFMSEFVGALTRQGKMPPMWLAMLYDKEWEPWYNKYGGKVRFHEDIYVPPLARGELGSRFLNQIRWHFRKFANTQLVQVHKAAELIVEEHAKGKKTVVTIAGHCMYDKIGKYEDSIWATDVSFHGWVAYETRGFVESTTTNSLVLVLSYCGFDKQQWATFIGARDKILLVTSENDPQIYPDFSAPREDALAVIDMGHAFGDACTRVDGYPIRLFPPSGIMQALTYEAVNIEVLAKIGNEKKTEPAKDPDPAKAP